MAYTNNQPAASKPSCPTHWIIQTKDDTVFTGARTRDLWVWKPFTLPTASYIPTAPCKNWEVSRTFQKFSSLCKREYHENFPCLPSQKDSSIYKEGYSEIISILKVLKDLVQFIASKTRICQKNAKNQLSIKIGLILSVILWKKTTVLVGTFFLKRRLKKKL